MLVARGSEPCLYRKVYSVTNLTVGSDDEPMSQNPFDGSTGKKSMTGPKKVAIGFGAILALGGAYLLGANAGNAEKEHDTQAATQTARSSVTPKPGESDPYFAAGQAAGESLAQSLLNEVSKGNAGAEDEAVELVEGDSVNFLCDAYDPESDTCMTATLTDLNTNTVCTNEYVEKGRYVSLTFEATMSSEVSRDFYSPLSIGNWSVATGSGKWTKVHDNSACDMEKNSDDLGGTFPGYSAEGTIWILVPDDADTLFFKHGLRTVFTVDL